MKLLSVLGVCLMPCVLVLSSCTQLMPPDKEEGHRVARYDQTGGRDVYCDAAQDGVCYLGLANHRPVHTVKPDVSVVVNKSAFAAGKCLARQLQVKFKLPPEFLQLTSYHDGGETLTMVNPFTHIKGVQIDVIRLSLMKSQINLYANNMELSKLWLNLPSLCR